MEEQEELVSIFSDGKVWINARVIRELLEDEALPRFSTLEVINALKIVLEAIEDETVISVSNQMLIDNGLMEE